MRAYKLPKIILIATMTLLLSACASTTQESTELNVMTTAGGPFFEGPNSLIAEYEVDMKELLSSEDYTLGDIEKIGIKNVMVELVEEDSTSMSDFTSVSLSIVSANEPLTGIATLNPIESTDNVITLSSSEEADLSAFFKEGKFTLILDWDFKADDYRDEMSSKINMNLNLELLSK